MEKILRVRFCMRNGEVIDDCSIIFKDDMSENDIANKIIEIRGCIKNAVGQSVDGYICLGYTYASVKDIIAVQLSGSAIDTKGEVR